MRVCVCVCLCVCVCIRFYISYLVIVTELYSNRRLFLKGVYILVSNVFACRFQE